MARSSVLTLVLLHACVLHCVQSQDPVNVVRYIAPPSELAERGKG